MTTALIYLGILIGVVTTHNVNTGKLSGSAAGHIIIAAVLIACVYDVWRAWFGRRGAP